MAKQLRLFQSEQIIPTALHTEMERSYLEYAMSVIVGRALPDVRDGLKPVHRRILYAMHELGLTPDRPYRKCARVVGDVLGKYHPHGDQAVYDALVRMVQDFSCRYPLLAGHGNFGSVDNDPPAAMRYTETRLSPISHESLLAEISESTVDFIPNFDNSQAEPVVLPAQLPILLLNGCSGIAVGMATNIPPHNLGEIVDGLIALIDNPELSDEKLMQKIPAPDFPTGGVIVDREGIRSAYLNGKGSIPMRGVATIEKIQPGKRKRIRDCIIVTELPYQVNKAGWIEKVADLVNHGKLDGISDIRDESDRSGMRVVLELKTDAKPSEVLAHLYHQTPLQTNFGAIFLALVNGTPQQLSLREVLQEFLKFREQTLTRQYSHELEQTRKRCHILEGLLLALQNLDRAIAILRNAADGTTAKAQLQKALKLQPAQADALLAMPMRRLTGLERQNLQTEFDQLTQRIQDLEQLLNERSELLKSLKKELRSLKRRYDNPRRTRLQTSNQGTSAPVSPGSRSQAKSSTSQGSSNPSKRTRKSKSSARQEQKMNELSLSLEMSYLEVTYGGYVRRVPELSAEAGEGMASALSCYRAGADADLLLLTVDGKAYGVKVGQVPTSSNSQGIPLNSLVPHSGTGQPPDVAAQFVLTEYGGNRDLVLVTEEGRIKRLPLAEFANLRASGLTALKLKEGDRLNTVYLSEPGSQLLLATSGGRILRLDMNSEQVPVLGRTAQGYQALRLRKQEQLVGCVVARPQDQILLVSEMGFGKRVPVEVIRQGNRGDIGTQALQFTQRSDRMVGMVLAPTGGQVQAVSSSQRFWRLEVDKVEEMGKDGTGDRLFKLQAQETLKGVYLLERPRSK
ncbi:DNA gyrase/topoisomerase IV subunit A [Roseofilum capinflatum]|uniref:DNA topoisomerase (ATP-hydrolyzing) n=1 Tax=Roseofilum capinflatum BLCC-M114 TaxID=3022440 RepID=A0ABT7B7H6_9CYAN|nr:DNA topoisomerase (ATP-hydrolyzing) [Roseofilum capinflatum]MDJ1175055.1 DNA topoisomerase 4 subunit A [Roseofilum capinflatum BLCC-M114]